MTGSLLASSSTIWYELQARDWPITKQPAEATIWLVGSGEGIKKVLAEISMGKEVMVRAPVRRSGRASEPRD